MTAIVPNLIRFKEKDYELIDPFSLIKPADLGFFSYRGIANTAVPSGIISTYLINNDRVYLDTVSCSVSLPTGIINRIIYSIRDYPPKINGVRAVPDESGFLDYNYENILLPLNYSGKIKIGIRKPGYEESFGDIQFYNPVYLLEFQKGYLSDSQKLIDQ